jgi:hypothetical protein
LPHGVARVSDIILREVSYGAVSAVSSASPLRPL